MPAANSIVPADDPRNLHKLKQPEFLDRELIGNVFCFRADFFTLLLRPSEADGFMAVPANWKITLRGLQIAISTYSPSAIHS
jgi:hypothetical protein